MTRPLRSADSLRGRRNKRSAFLAWKERKSDAPWKWIWKGEKNPRRKRKSKKERMALSISATLTSRPLQKSSQITVKWWVNSRRGWLTINSELKRLKLSSEKKRGGGDYSVAQQLKRCWVTFLSKAQWWRWLFVCLWTEWSQFEISSSKLISLNLIEFCFST